MAIVHAVIIAFAVSLLSATPIVVAAVEENTVQNDVSELVETARQLPMHDPEKERLYKKALTLSPSNSQVLFNLALLLQANNKYIQASGFYRQLLKQNPKDKIAHYNLANVLLALDDTRVWQASAWHFRQFMFYASKGEKFTKAAKMLDTLEINLAKLYSSYRNKDYAHDQLITILTQVESSDAVRGRSKYDGPRLPLMLNFAPQSAELTSEAKRKLDDIAAVLTLPILRDDQIQIEGYTDSHEYREFEQRTRVAKQRAQRVKRYLQQVHHIDLQRLTIKSFADLEIISANNTPEGRAANRRVELYNLSKGRRMIAPLHN